MESQKARFHPTAIRSPHPGQTPPRSSEIVGNGLCAVPGALRKAAPFVLLRRRTRTHFNAKRQWHLAATGTFLLVSSCFRLRISAGIHMRTENVAAIEKNIAFFFQKC